MDGMCRTQRAALTRIAYWPEEPWLPTLTQHIANARNHRCTEADIQHAVTQRTTKGDINLTQRRRRQLDDF